MLAAFKRAYPGLYLSVTVGNSADVLRDLLDYRTDVAVLAHSIPIRGWCRSPTGGTVRGVLPQDHALRGAASPARSRRPAHDRARGRLDHAARLRRALEAAA